MPDINQHLYTGAQIPVNIGAVGEVKVEELLGSGGFGVVCRVTDLETGASYALKVIRNINSTDEEVKALQLVERIRREAAVDIPSPHVVRALGIREWDESTFLILFEFFPGRSLGELIHDKSLSDRQKCDVIRQVLQGIADAHRCNVIHRDLKPDNVLVGSDGTVKVIDFGLAKFASRRITTDGSFFGTLRYMAPELLQNGSHLADTRSDIYSLGHVFYEMVQGQHYWQRAQWRGLEDFAAYLKRVPTPKFAIDAREFQCDLLPNAKETISDMVRLQPEERPATVGQILARLGMGKKVAPSPVSDMRTLSPVLIVESGYNPNARTVVKLPDGERRVIGRSNISPLDSSVSRNHAEISRQGGQYFIADLNSKNGTLLRGRAVEPNRPMEIRPGDKLKMGEVFLRFAFLDAV